MLSDFAKVAATVAYARPRLTLVSDLTGEVFGARAKIPTLATGSATRGTRSISIDGINTLSNLGYRLFVEIGPTPTLCGPGATLRASGIVAVAAVAGARSLRLGDPAGEPGRPLPPRRARRLEGLRSRLPAADRDAAGLPLRT